MAKKLVRLLIRMASVGPKWLIEELARSFQSMSYTTRGCKAKQLVSRREFSLLFMPWFQLTWQACGPYDVRHDHERRLQRVQGRTSVGDVGGRRGSTA